MMLSEFKKNLEIKEGDRVEVYVSYHQRRHVFVIGEALSNA